MTSSGLAVALSWPATRRRQSSAHDATIQIRRRQTMAQASLRPRPSPVGRILHGKLASRLRRAASTLSELGIA